MRIFPPSYDDVIALIELTSPKFSFGFNFDPATIGLPRSVWGGGGGGDGNGLKEHLDLIEAVPT